MHLGALAKVPFALTQSSTLLTSICREQQRVSPSRECSWWHSVCGHGEVQGWGVRPILREGEEPAVVCMQWWVTQTELKRGWDWNLYFISAPWRMLASLWASLLEGWVCGFWKSLNCWVLSAVLCLKRECECPPVFWWCGLKKLRWDLGSDTPAKGGDTLLHSSSATDGQEGIVRRFSTNLWIQDLAEE